MLATLIRLRGHRVFTARDGVQALAQVKAVVPDAAVLDLEMPRLSGFDAAAIIASAYPACVLNSFTGHEKAAVLAKARQTGFSHIVGKRSIEDLLSVLARLSTGRVGGA